MKFTIICKKEYSVTENGFLSPLTDCKNIISVIINNIKTTIPAIIFTAYSPFLSISAFILASSLSSYLNCPSLSASLALSIMLSASPICTSA